MKNLFIFFLLSLNLSVFGQEKKKFIVSGIVLDCKTKLPIQGIPVRLIGGDGSAIQVETNIEGKYKIVVTPKRLPLPCIINFNWFPVFSPTIAAFSPYETEKTRLILADSLGTEREINSCIINMFEAESGILYSSSIHKEYSLSGTVTDCKYKDSIQNVMIKLVGSDGSSIETKTDKNGSYFFDSTKVHRNTQYIVTTQVGTEIKTSSNQRGYINSSDKNKFHTYGYIEKKDLKIDFCLVPREPCTILNLPTLLFEKNSAKNYRFDPKDNSPYDTLSFLANFINDNSLWIFEIQSYADSKEKDPEKIALLRAEFIKTELVKLGVEADRLKIRNYADKVPKKNFSEQNPRITFKYISNDYILKNPPKEQPKTNETEEDEGK